MTTLVRAANPIWWLPDLTGVSLNDEYYAFFLTNTFPYVPQAVYQGPATTDPVWPSPLEFSPAGTLPDNLYFDPNLVYRIEVRHGNTQADALIWEINNFVPGENGAGPAVENELTVAANLITNPQFADIYFQSPFTFTTAASSTYTFDIGPGWQIIVTGTGTLTVTQHTNAGTSHITGNPPYYLDIMTSNWTTAILRQKLANNGAIFSGGAIAIALTAAAVTSAKVLTVQYAPSTGSATNIFQLNIPTGALTPYTGYANTGDSFHPLPLSTNSDVGTAAFVNIDFLLPGTGELQLTNIQVVGQSDPLTTGFDTDTDLPAFRELTYEQVENGEFNVYKEGLIFKPIPSYLVGWNFPLNPAQLTARAIVAPTMTGGANRSLYAWDQTILFSAVDNVLSFEEDSGTYGFSVVNTGADTAFAVIQYLDVSVLADLLANRLSVQLNGYSFNTTDATLKGTVSLYWTDAASLPDINVGTFLSLVSAVDVDGVPTVANGGPWTGINNDRLNTVNMPFTFSNTPSDTVSLSGFEAAGATAVQNATFFAIVVAFAPVPNTGGATLNYVSLVNGDIPSKPAAQTFDEVLLQCQYYLEKSYSNNVVPGTVSANNYLQAEQITNTHGGGGAIAGSSRSFGFPYESVKVSSTPIVSLYSPATGTTSGIYGTVSMKVYNGAVLIGSATDLSVNTNWAVTLGNKAISFIPKNVNALVDTGVVALDNQSEAIIQFHYTADARLGVV